MVSYLSYSNSQPFGKQRILSISLEWQNFHSFRFVVSDLIPVTELIYTYNLVLEKLCWSQQYMMSSVRQKNHDSVKIWKAHLDCSAQPFTAFVLQIVFDYHILTPKFHLPTHTFQFRELELSAIIEHFVYRGTVLGKLLLKNC